MCILLWIYLLLMHTAASCPNLCICKWKAGKEWVECASRGFQGLPQGAREETQVFDLSGNQLLNLSSDCFFILRLFNLQKLYLGRSHIQYVSARAFTGLQGLVELELSENELDRVPSEAFISIGNLMRLNLSGNPLKVLQHNNFIHLSQLSFLDLSHCQLSQIESGVFANLHKLEWLRLNDNLLTSVPENVLPLSASLHDLSMHGNPWRCDCLLSTLRDWLMASQIQTSQEMEPSCAEPLTLMKRSVRTLKIQDLACIPRVKLIDYLNIYEGENVTLNCEVQAVPQPAIIWLLNGKQLNLENSAIKEEKFRYTYSQYSKSGKIITSLNILDVKELDEGNFVCQAENAAGIASDNLTLFVLHSEHNTIDPSIEDFKTGYVAAITTSALLGSLLALGCLFLGIFLYAQNLRTYSKNNSKVFSIRTVTSLSIFKKKSNKSPSKIHSVHNCTYTMNTNSKSNDTCLQNTSDQVEIVCLETNVRTIKNLALIDSPNKVIPLIGVPETLEVREHTESPDEGYVGDVMDI
ncbi:PREDICTED: immunoglobulin superfamily member 10-like [Ceratosolen solmsi marchali]|uniref:Immunoglobulin superfamily member 10-like n=1 Tax=Ceratosolen solmsi marchali TaxID=326594 RepID=A0AAJ6YDN7_9HYME|nr:PREDICTED: immunoglobulin superfamily member 10-like [Ceratosolen solmsi marchali]